MHIAHNGCFDIIQAEIVTKQHIETMRHIGVFQCGIIATDKDHFAIHLSVCNCLTGWAGHMLAIEILNGLSTNKIGLVNVLNIIRLA